MFCGATSLIKTASAVDCMAECSECGKESMSFTCRYCGEKYCSEHRLPENHDCDGLEETIEEEKEESQKWFTEEKVKNPAPSQKEPEYRKPTIRHEIGRALKNNYVMTVIGFTSLVFMLQLFMGESPTSNTFYSLFVLDPALSGVLTQPWTLITILFIHASFLHIFANMVTLYFFGKPIENAIGGKEFLKFYLGAGVVSSIGYIVFRNLLSLIHSEALSCAVPGMCGNLLGTMGPAVGASGAVVACFAVVAMIYPEAEVLLYFVFPMKIRTALNLFIGIEALNLATKLLGYSLPYIGGLASSAHLAGILIGLWYGKKVRDRIGSRRTMFEIMAR